jgi:hypothetical protein
MAMLVREDGDEAKLIVCSAGTKPYLLDELEYEDEEDGQDTGKGNSEVRPSVFGRNSQCELVRKVNFREDCHWSHVCSLQASRRGIQWHPRVQISAEKRAPYPQVFPQRSSALPSFTVTLN